MLQRQILEMTLVYQKISFYFLTFPHKLTQIFLSHSILTRFLDIKEVQNLANSKLSYNYTAMRLVRYNIKYEIKKSSEKKISKNHYSLRKFLTES